MRILNFLMNIMNCKI